MHRYDFSWDRHSHIRLSSRSLPRSQSLYFVQEPYSPPPANLEGEVSYYPKERIAAMLERTAGLDRKAYFQDIVAHILKDTRTDKERVSRICSFVGDAIYYNPIQLPLEEDAPKTDTASNGNVIDAVALLELHDGRCGNGVTATLALLEAAGIEGRTLPLNHHVAAEARYEGGWHLADALMFGANQPHQDGEVLSADDIRKDPYFTDAFPLPYLYGTLEEYFTEDGFRCLGYAFGEWGSSIMPYYSYYWNAPMDIPPTLPYPLVAQRLGEQRVRLNWSPSFKKGGGNIEYQVEIFSDRDCRHRIAKARTPVNSYEWDVPQGNTIYFFEVRAMDDHRLLNPDTWYMPVRNNFMLVPEDQYGWYGVI